MFKKFLMLIVLTLLSHYLSLGYALQDPTVPAIDVKRSQNLSVTFVLTEIIFSKERKIAIINGEMKQLGDDILGNKVIAIHKNTVQLEGPNGKIILFLLGKPVKRVSQFRESEE